VETPALLLIAIALPTAVGYAVVAVRRGLRWRDAHRAPRAEDPLGRLYADLRRLHDQLDAVELAPNVPAKHLRRDAVRAAYLDALAAASRRVGVAPPAAQPSGRVPQAEIYRVEAELRRHGLDVRGAPTVR
jgi:hypothetical protein